MALAPNTLISYDRLIELLWDGAAPRQARVIVQTRVSELRKALLANGPADPMIELSTRTSGYVLAIAPDQVDAHRFTQALSRARTAADELAALDILRDGLALWRGPLLGGDLSAAAQASVSHELESMRLTAAEDRYELEIKLGHHHLIVDEVRAVATANPARERLTELMMLAMHRSGRSAEALKEYDRWRRWLAEAFGADPGGRVQRLHLAILRQEPVLLAQSRRIPPAAAADDGDSLGPQFSVAVPRILPPDLPDFTGRATEVELLREILGASGAGPQAAVALSGPAGVGKTTLSIHVAHTMRSDFPDGQLYANLRGADDKDRADPYAVLGRFLRAVGVDGGAVPATMEERIDLYRDLLSDRRVLVLLDNAADDAQVLPLIPGGSSCGVIVTSRARLGAALGARRIHLDVLDPGDAILVLRSVAGISRTGTDPVELAELCRLCGHLPLALRVAGAKLSARPHWSVRKLVGLLRDERGRLDHLSHGHLDVRASITLSYEDLGEDDRRMLRRLADLDLPEVSVWIAAAVLDAQVGHAEMILERLYDAQLLEFAGSEVTGHPRYRMHDLIRLFARERADRDEHPDSLRAARERSFAAWLAMVDAARRALRLVDYEFGHPTAARWPLEAALVDGLVADQQEWFERERPGIIAAVERAADDGHNAVCAEIVDAASMLFAMRRHFDEWQRLVEVAVRLARQRDDRRNEAVLLCRLGLVYSACLRDVDAHNMFIRSAELFRESGDSHGEAIALSWCAMLPRSLNDYGAALRILQDAQLVFRAYDDLVGMAFTAQRIGRIHLDMGSYEAADVALEQSLDTYRLVSSAQGQAQALYWRGGLRMRQGGYAEAEADFSQALSISQSLGDPSGIAQCLRGLGLNSLQRGDHERARMILTYALYLVRQPTPTRIEELIRQDLGAF